MEIFEMVEAMAKNPLLDMSCFEDSILNKNLIESYKNSDTHRIRELISGKKEFSDMSHVIPFSEMSDVFSVPKEGVM